MAMDQNSIIELVRSTAADEARQTEALVASKIELQMTLLKEELRKTIQDEVKKSLEDRDSDAFTDNLPTILAILRTPALRKAVTVIALLLLGAGGHELAEEINEPKDTPAVHQSSNSQKAPSSLPVPERGL